MMQWLVWIVTAVLSENVIFSRSLGISALSEESAESRFYLRFCGTVIGVMSISGAISFLFCRFLLQPLGLAYLQTILFLLLIAAILFAAQQLVRHFAPENSPAWEKCFSLLFTDCATLGVLLLNSKRECGFTESLLYGFSSAVGFSVAILLFAGVRERLRDADPPESFAGMPLLLVAAGLVAMAFSGFYGIRFA